MSRNHNVYIKVWEKYNNKKLPNGYEIHHIDGNHDNNDPSNLLAVTIDEHLEIHKSQGDHSAVQAILMRKNRSEEDIALLKESASKHQKKLFKEGKHNFQKSEDKKIDSIKKMMQTRIEKYGVSFLGIENTKINGKNARSKLSREKELEMMKLWREKVSGSKWWNNGKINKRSKEKPGNDFVEGMIKK